MLTGHGFALATNASFIDKVVHKHVQYPLEVCMETFVKTGSVIWDSFCPTVASFLSKDKSFFVINGRLVSGYRSPDTTPIWLRDHTHQMKGFKYFEKDMTSTLDIFQQYQMRDGAFYDFFVEAEEESHDLPVCESDDSPVYVHDRFRYDHENRIKFARCGVESDVEYLAVEAVYGAWQATGDDIWMAAKLPSLDRALTYSLTSPARWSAEYQLVKRPFTIDTWDFEYVGEPEESKERFRHSDVKHGNYWCIMHGDNSGMFKACNLIAKMYGHIGNHSRAQYWKQWAVHFKKQTDIVCWNGRFYTHQVHITPVVVKDVDEREQLSLSNTYNMNRGLPDHTQCVSIIKEYLRRREANRDRHFAEWYSIDPPFPSEVFGLDYLHPGIYVNGGIMPLVGGELAHAAFEHGFESYGVDILRRYYELAIKPLETYLWYKPDGTHVTYSTFLPSDGWGSAAMLYAFIEGLCGVKDIAKQFETVMFSPRWAVTEVDNAEVSVGYPASQSGFTYVWQGGSVKWDYSLKGTFRHIKAHILLPEGKDVADVKVDGKSVDWVTSNIEASTYVDFEVFPRGAETAIELSLV
jgi:hypothetical protein